MKIARPAANEVFTPRNPDVNRDMYISRPNLERKIGRAVKGTQHIIIFGDSGSGKTWLYKEHFRVNSIPFRTVDLSVALTEGIDASLAKSLPTDVWKPVKRTVEGAGSADLWVVKAGANVTTEYEAQFSPLDALLNDLASENSPVKFIVFDNFEQVSVRKDLMEAITSLVIRLDSPNFAQHKVKFLFVGVVADMKELIASYDHAGTVANRVTEIPEVERLTHDEAKMLVERGLFEKLQIDYAGSRQELINRVLFLTNRNAQQIHELCYEIGCEAEENSWVLSEVGFRSAERDWIEKSLSHYNAHIESRMNKRETKIQRRNQVLFCLGATESYSLKAAEIDAMIREIFPDTVSVDQLGVDQILAGLADGKNPILIRNPNESSYRLAHPKLRLAIRVRLEQFAPNQRNKSENLENILNRLITQIDEFSRLPKP